MCRELFQQHENIINRDANAALNILSRGFEKIELGQSKATTPVKTALPTFTASDRSAAVEVKRVIETGSSRLEQAALVAE